jgi:hypothetical protein
MEISYKYLSWFFMALLAIILFGFQRYFLSFPGFNGFNYVHHIHAISLLLWFGMLFIQPVLIYKKKFALHRILGKVSYFLVPFIVFFTLMAMKTQYMSGVKEKLPHEFSCGTDSLCDIIHPGYCKQEKHKISHEVYDSDGNSALRPRNWSHKFRYSGYDAGNHVRLCFIGLVFYRLAGV